MNIWVLIPITLVAIGYAVHRLALWADDRGWLYYKTKPKFKGSSLGVLESIYNPAMEHVMEEQSGEISRASEDESGDDPHEEELPVTV